MVITRSGLNGRTAVSLAVEDCKQGQDSAPVLLHNTEEKPVRDWGPLMKPSHATRTNAVSFYLHSNEYL